MMKLRYLAATLLSYAALSTAQAQIVDRSTLQSTATTASNISASPQNISYVALTGVKTNMQRMLRSTDGQYFLHLNAGIWNPKALLSFINIEREIQFEGLQKGDQLTLKSIASDTDLDLVGEYQLNGRLNADLGDFKARLQQRGQGEAANLSFEPAFKVSNKPTFVFKYLTQTGTSQKNIQRVDVYDKQSQKVVQSLTGFNANNKKVDYIDVNFDGYYDLVLMDAAVAEIPHQQLYIYWMYNPKTQRFQRSTIMEKLNGYPHLNGLKQQIDFGDDRVYQVTNGLLNRL